MLQSRTDQSTRSMHQLIPTQYVSGEKWQQTKAEKCREDVSLSGFCETSAQCVFGSGSYQKC